MMKKNVRCLIGVFMMAFMLFVLSGCSDVNDSGDDEQVVIEVEDKQVTEQNILSETEHTASGEESQETEKESSGEDLDKVMPSAADDDWYAKGSIYTDDKGNRLEVFFNDYGVLEFAVNGLSMYITTVDNFQQENNWKVYTCDDGTIIGYFPGEPAHIEIGDGDYAGLYEEGGDKVN